jgi:hypothetical protein
LDPEQRHRQRRIVQLPFLGQFRQAETFLHAVAGLVGVLEVMVGQRQEQVVERAAAARVLLAGRR